MNEWMHSPSTSQWEKETNWSMELNSQTHTVSLWFCQTTWRKKTHLSNLICIHLLWNRIWNSIFDAVRIIIIIACTPHPALALSLYIYNIHIGVFVFSVLCIGVCWWMVFRCTRQWRGVHLLLRLPLVILFFPKKGRDAARMLPSHRITPGGRAIEKKVIFFFLFPFFFLFVK